MDNNRFAYKRMSRGQLIGLATRFRKNPRPAERLLWKELEDHKLAGHKFLMQHPLYNFIIDFFCPAASLAVEIDCISRKHPDIQARDDARDELLARRGVAVLRFTSRQVYRDLDKVLGTILNELEKRSR